MTSAATREAPVAEPAAHHCPLCGYQFNQGAAHCGACPMAPSCGTTRCPSCHYEFFDRSETLDALQRYGRAMRTVFSRWRASRGGAR